MKKSTAKDVRRFLAAFIDVVVDNGVRLTDGCWVNGKEHCLLGELIHRSNQPIRAVLWSDEAARLLGVTYKEVDSITAGWDGELGLAPFVRMGRWLRARYELRCSRRTNKISKLMVTT